MRIARVAAFAFTAFCLAAAAVWLLAPVEYTFCAGGDCTTVSCGSPAFPKELIDLGPDGIDAAANCAGLPSAGVALYAVAAAGVGLVAVALTSRRRSGRTVRSSGAGA